MKNILLVSVAFPPKNDPECLQTAKYFKYLALQNDLGISVATSSLPTLFMPYDSNLEKYNDKFIQKIEIPIMESKLTNFFLRKIIPGGIDYPDAKFTFHWHSNRVIRLLKNKPDVIYSRSNPLSSSILAFKLANYFKVPWVMHLSDPWADSPIKDYNEQQRAYHEEWEKKCFTKAHYVCLTSHHTVEFYKNKYRQINQKFLYFPNVYDPVDISTDKIDFTGKLRIVYTGGLAGNRSPLNFLESCSQLLKEKPDLENLFEVQFAGALDRKNRELFNHYRFKNVVHLGELPYAKALELIKKSHVLLNIDLPIKKPRMAMFFASKILDYFLARRKIISLTSKGSASEEVLRNVNAAIVELDDVQAIKLFLEEAIGAFGERNHDFFTLKLDSNEFNAKNNSERLAEVIRSL